MTMEYRSIGVLEYWKFPCTPLLHYSITPLLHYSITPLLHHSIEKDTMRQYISDSSEELLKTIGYCGAFIAFGMVGAILGPTLPKLAENTHTSLSKISILFTARSFGYLSGAFLLGRLYDRFPGHPLLAIGILGIAITAALTPVMPFLWVLTLIIFLTGMSESIIEVGNNTLIVWIYRHNVGPYMNALHFFFGVGAFISPIIVAKTQIITDDVTWAYWIIALLMIPAIIWVLAQKSPQIQGVSDDGVVEEIDYLLIALICLLFLLYVGAEVGFGGWIYTYTVSLQLGDNVAAAYLTSAFWGALTLGRLVAIPLAARLRPQTVVLIDFIGSLLSLLIILCINTLPALWVGTLGFGLSMASFFPTMLAFAERRMQITGRINSWFGIGAALGAMTLPLLIGQLFEPFGPRVTMVVILIDMIVAVGFFVVLLLYSARLKK